MSNLYFDSQNDTDLIRPDYRSHVDLDFWAEQVERYVVDEYTQVDNQDYENYLNSQYILGGVVRLTEYEEDPANADADFKKAFKRLVAHILNHGILPNLDKEEHLEAYKSGKRSWQYADAYGELDFWPTGSSRFLKEWDYRTPRYHL